MSSINSEEIISILKEEIENYDAIARDQETGTVIYVGDGIANVYGIDHAMYGEIVTFENGLKGMVQDIRTNSMGCILFGSDTGIREGTKVSRTGKQAGIPVGDGFIGIVDLFREFALRHVGKAAQARDIFADDDREGVLIFHGFIIPRFMHFVNGYRVKSGHSTVSRV